VWELAAANVAYKLAQAVILLPIWALLWKLLGGTPYQLTATNFALFLLTLTLAAALNFLVGYCFGMLAFWTVRIGGFYEMFAWGIGYFLSGRLAPLEVLPSWVQVIADWLPFRYIIALPVEVLMGRAEPSLIVKGIVVQVAWLTICLIAKRLLWHFGLRQYTAVGG
jgi:ABC-2 type transport system permease protein